MVEAKIKMYHPELNGSLPSLTKRVQAETRAAFGKPLTLVGGSGRKGEMGRLLTPILDSVSYVSSGDPVQDAEVNKRIPQVAGILLGGNMPIKESYIDGIGENGIENLPLVAIDIAGGSADKTGTVFRMVCGATEEMPLRAVSYPLPVLQMMDAIAGLGVRPPQLQMVLATNISSSLNGLDAVRVAQQTDAFVNAEEEYIGRFFPRLVDRVVFLEDTPLPEQRDIHRAYGLLTETLAEKGDEQIVAALLKKGQSTSGNTNLSYSAAHVLFHDMHADGLLKPYGRRTQAEAISPQTIINVGGHQEKDFYLTRFHLLDLIDTLPFGPVATLQLFTQHHVPPYYMARDGDVPLTAIEGSLTVGNAARRDLQYLEQVSFARGDYKEFIALLQEGELYAL